MVIDKHKSNYKELRHGVLCSLAELSLGRMSPSEIIRSCPPEYGLSVTSDHKNCVWNSLYDHWAEMDDALLAAQLIENIRLIGGLNV